MRNTLYIRSNIGKPGTYSIRSIATFSAVVGSRSVDQESSGDGQLFEQLGCVTNAFDILQLFSFQGTDILCKYYIKIHRITG